MRRVLTAGLAAAIFATVPLATATSAMADPVIAPAFGLTVPQIANGLVPAMTYGTVRIWDVGVTWGKVQTSEKKYWWTGLDKAIQNAQKQNAKILYVLGSTPTWAASDTKQGTYPNKGAASMPKSMSLWKDWVTTLVKRYNQSIDSYQIWNEANLSTFWMGTPTQMADLTQEAYKIIRKYDPTATVVSASSTVRLTASYNKFFPAYLKALKKNKWPIDVYSVHLYPESTGTPAARVGYIAQVRASLAAAGAPAKALWDTEINYGLAGPGSSFPKVNIDGDNAAAYVSQTYLDDIRLGVGRAYWYSYTPSDYSLVGIQMTPVSVGTAAFRTTYNWVVGSDTTCVSAAVNVCTINKAGVISTVAWASTGSGAYTVPAGVTTKVTASGVSSAAVAGTSVTIGSMPTWFGKAS